MNVRATVSRWHPGQLATVIIVGLVIERVVLAGIRYNKERHGVNGTVAFLVLLTILLGAALARISWDWFGSRQRGESSKGGI